MTDNETPHYGELYRPEETTHTDTHELNIGNVGQHDPNDIPDWYGAQPSLMRASQRQRHGSADEPTPQARYELERVQYRFITAGAMSLNGFTVTTDNVRLLRLHVTQLQSGTNYCSVVITDVHNRIVAVTPPMSTAEIGFSSPIIAGVALHLILPSDIPFLGMWGTNAWGSAGGSSITPGDANSVNVVASVEFSIAL